MKVAFSLQSFQPLRKTPFLSSVALVLILIFSAAPGFAAEVKSAAQGVPAEALSVVLKGKAVYFNPDRDFEMANVGNFAAANAAGRQGGERPLHFRTDGWGGGYELGVKFPRAAGAAWRWGVFYEQYFQRRRASDTAPGVGSGALAAVPFIDGHAHGASGTYGFFASADVIAGSNSPATLTLQHYFDYQAASVRAESKSCDIGPFKTKIYLGPAFAQFSHDYIFDTLGTNAGAGGITASRTVEELDDYLIGGIAGLKEKLPLTEKLTLTAGQECSLYGRLSYFYGDQNITNAAGTGVGGTFTGLTERITIRDSQTGFVPHFAANAALKYAVASNISVSIVYEFDAWLNLGRVHNPVVFTNLISVDGNSGIRKQDLFSQYIGGTLVWEFD